MQLPSSFVAVFSAALLFLFFFAAGAGALSCHECDEVDTAVRSPCPGGRVTFGKPFDACIVYRLSSGRIVYQSAVDSKRAGNLCSRSVEDLKGVIRRAFREEGTAMCCRDEGCNRDIPASFKGGASLWLEHSRAVPNRLDEGGEAEGENGSRHLRSNPAIAILILPVLFLCGRSINIRP